MNIRSSRIFPPSSILCTLLFLSSALFAQVSVDDNSEVQKAEIKLIDPLDDERGWCVDLFAHLTRALPLGGFQGHNCFLYMGKGPTEDQAFDSVRFSKTGELYLVYYDVCLTMHDPNPGSFVAAEACNEGPAQKFDISDEGYIKSKMKQNRCLTLGDLTIPGGGRLAPVGARPPSSNEGIPQIRRLTFETCNEGPAKLQKWSFRSGIYTAEKPTEQHRFFIEDK